MLVPNGPRALGTDNRISGRMWDAHTRGPRVPHWESLSGDSELGAGSTLCWPCPQRRRQQTGLRNRRPTFAEAVEGCDRPPDESALNPQHQNVPAACPAPDKSVCKLLLVSKQLNTDETKRQLPKEAGGQASSSRSDALQPPPSGVPGESRSSSGDCDRDTALTPCTAHVEP